MKKLSLTIALILCLAIAVFAFAACGKSGKTDGTTAAKTAAPTAAETTAEPTAEPTTAGHVHTPASEYTIDVEATCTNAGQKSYHCTECGQVIEETIVVIDQLPHTPEDHYTILQKATCNATGLQAYLCEECGETIEDTIVDIPIDPTAHVVEEWSAEPTLLTPSVEATGTCTVCQQSVNKTLTYEAPIKSFADSGVKFKPVTTTLGEARGEDKHFYPTESDQDGNDLYIEFNILWNESFANFDKSYMIGQMGGKPFFFLSPAPGAKYADAQFAGAFEWMGHFEIPITDSEVTTPATMCGANPNYADYPNIAGTDQEHPEYGWHRLGIRIHMELLDNKTGENLSDYVEFATIFVDGVALCKLSTTSSGLASDQTKLFDAAPDEGGNVVFSDMDANEVVPFEISTAKALAGTKVYVAVDDFSVTCGKGFVMPVEKVSNPTPATLDVDEGVSVTSTVWFRAASN